MDYIEELKQIINPGRISVKDILIEQHSHDASYHSPAKPDVVVFPENTTEVSKLLAFANEHHIPVTPYGRGSSLEGHAIPYKGGISLDLAYMNKFIRLSQEDFLVTVGPGMTQFQLNNELDKYNLFFSVDPGAEAALGGMAGTNASGSYTVKYGTMQDNVRSMEVVLANGEIIRTNSLAAKSSSGIKLKDLFIGSEGTLGVITELTLEVYPKPVASIALRAVYENFQDAIGAVVAVRTAGIEPARIEFVDAASVAHVNQFSGTSYTEMPTIFMELQGTAEEMKAQLKRIKDLAEPFGPQELLSESDPEQQQLLWDARHNLANYYVQAAPDKKMMVTDVCVPISELADAITFTRGVVERSGIEAGILGHVGDGNFHVILMVDFENNEEAAAAKNLNEEIVNYALAHEGTCTGEHGVGIGKRDYQAKEHGTSYEVMKSIKKSMDPNNILNPGKIFTEVIQ